MRSVAVSCIFVMVLITAVGCGETEKTTPDSGSTVSPIQQSAELETPIPVTIEHQDIETIAVDILMSDGAPHITSNVRVGDLLGDSSSQLFISEPTRGQVVWVRGPGDHEVFSDGLREPVRTHVLDMDSDGDKDVLVADIGTLWESDAKVGRVVLLRNLGNFEFRTEVLLDGVGRIACAEGADLDSDGDMDIAVCVFGNNTGKMIWMEQKEGFQFVEHVLDERPGAIHAFPFDSDGDSDMDLAVALSQDYEEVLLFRNEGHGNFAKEVLFDSDKIYFAMTGIELVDLDHDGDTDILITNGDALNFYEVPEGVDPNDVHGLSWLENDGTGKFVYRDIIRIWGAYSVRSFDVDGDDDMDLVLSTMQLPEIYPGSELQGMIWLENDGKQNFTRHDVHLDVPPLTVTIELFDLDRDGNLEVLGGTMDQAGGDAGHRLFSFDLLKD